MYKVSINGKQTFQVESGKIEKIDGEEFLTDTSKLSDDRFHILHNYKSYTAEVVDFDPETKTFRIKVNNTVYESVVKDRFDDLLKDLGMDNMNAVKVGELKAPMPGLVVDVRVKEGDVLKKGDAVLVLEAMKMENILKCPADVTVKKINVTKGDKVEKNQVLINFM